MISRAITTKGMVHPTAFSHCDYINFKHLKSVLDLFCIYPVDHI